MIVEVGHLYSEIETRQCSCPSFRDRRPGGPRGRCPIPETASSQSQRSAFEITPTLATVPPGRAISVHMSEVEGIPTASMATSTLWPPVWESTWFFQAASPESTTSVAPNARDCSRRLRSKSMAMSGCSVEARSGDGGLPHGACKATATVSRGLTPGHTGPRFRNLWGRMSESMTA